jgi:hypothetical protein
MAKLLADRRPLVFTLEEFVPIALGLFPRDEFPERGNVQYNAIVEIIDSAIVFSIAVQHGADVETIRRALCRDSHGRASGPLGKALDCIVAGYSGR